MITYLINCVFLNSYAFMLMFYVVNGSFVVFLCSCKHDIPLDSDV